MSGVKTPIRLPLILVSLAALLLLLSACALLFSLFDRAGVSERQQNSQEFATTVNELSAVVSGDNVEWVQSDQLAQLVATADVQVKRLADAGSGVSSLMPVAGNVGEVSADWQQLRERLLSFNQTTRLTGTNQQPVVPESVSPPDTAPMAVPDDVIALAADFEEIRTRVTEGTREQSLIDLVDNTSQMWAQADRNIESVVAQQKINADALIRLSKVGTQESLYGYYTSNQILEYATRVQNIQLAEPVAAVAESNTTVVIVSNSVSGNTAGVDGEFVDEALATLQKSVAKLNGSSATTANRIDWFGFAGLATSLLLLLSAIAPMVNAAKAFKTRSTREHQMANEIAQKMVRESAPDIERSSSTRGALSLREADQLIEDINQVADGDLRQTVRAVGKGHGKSLADSANRYGSIIQNLVGMTRGVAGRLDGLTQRHEQHSRTLAEHDIRRQSETAELSDSIGVGAELLDYQKALLSSSRELIKEIDNRSESAVNGVSQVSASLATVSAQVEVSSGRMQRLLRTAESVTQATHKLKQLTEQTRLQALNISLQVPEMTEEPVTGRDYSEFGDFGATEKTTSLFDDIHQLTGKLVQISNETDTLTSALRKDIEETAQALKASSEEINLGARHTHSTSLIGKELESYSDQMTDIVDQTLQNIETQKSELSQTANRIVRLDKSGNAYSELTLALTQDVANLKEMAVKLEESVSGFKMHGDASVE